MLWYSEIKNGILLFDQELLLVQWHVHHSLNDILFLQPLMPGMKFHAALQ